MTAFYTIAEALARQLWNDREALFTFRLRMPYERALPLTRDAIRVKAFEKMGNDCKVRPRHWPAIHKIETFDARSGQGLAW